MSRGLGSVGRAIEAAFLEHPERTFTLADLAQVVFGTEGPHSPAQYNSVARAAKQVAAKVGWIKRRRGSDRRDLTKTIFLHPDKSAERDRQWSP